MGLPIHDFSVRGDLRNILFFTIKAKKDILRKVIGRLYVVWKSGKKNKAA